MVRNGTELALFCSISPDQMLWILFCSVRERRRSRGENDEDEEEEVPEDPKIQREMDEISKIKDESGIGKVIFQELAELKHKPPKPVDPWKASRVPSAKYEPRYHTRYQSPMFACKSLTVICPRRGTFTCWGCCGLCPWWHPWYKPTELCPLLFILFLCLFLSLWPFQLYFIP